MEVFECPHEGTMITLRIPEPKYGTKEDIRDPWFEGSDKFKFMSYLMCLMSAMLVPCAYFHGHQCQPSVTTALSAWLRLSVSDGVDIETGEWGRETEEGRKDGYGKVIGNSQHAPYVMITFVPEFSLLPALDVEGLPGFEFRLRD